jgi:uncharacterized membrane protein YecN with MAPEG domain
MPEYTWLAIFAALNVGIVTALALNVSYLRITRRIANGDGGQVELKKAIRTHLNGVEHVSMFGIIVIASSLLPEAQPALPWLIVTFSIARFFHAIGMLNSAFNLRRIAAALTYLAEFSGVIWLLYAITI